MIKCKQESEIRLYMGMEIDVNDLHSKDEVLALLCEHGSPCRDLTDALEDWYGEKYQYQLHWRYPISAGECNGAYIVPVREGLLSIPYDEVDYEDYEILLPKEASIMDGKECQYLVQDLMAYATGLCSAIKDACGMYNLEVPVIPGEEESAVLAGNSPVEAGHKL